MKVVEDLREVLAAVTEHRAGLTVMVSGFMGVGSAQNLLEYLSTQDLPPLDLICSDAALSGQGVGTLLAKARSITGSHFGLNRDVTELARAGKLDVQLVPQGTLAERIRAAGAGLGGILTPTGLGTEVAQGKQVLELQGREYLLELPLRADMALLKAHIADSHGNLRIEKTCKNFNMVMASAAAWVIVEVDKIVGQLDPEDIHVPHIFVDQLVPATLLRDARV